jgi:hypothetical protein
MTAAEIISTAGVTVLLATYWLERSGRLPVGPRVHSLNMIGAGTAAIGSALIPFIPFVVLESCWALLSLRELLRSRRPTAAAP